MQKPSWLKEENLTVWHFVLFPYLYFFFRKYGRYERKNSDQNMAVLMATIAHMMTINAISLLLLMVTSWSLYALAVQVVLTMACVIIIGSAIDTDHRLTNDWLESFESRKKLW